MLTSAPLPRPPNAIQAGRVCGRLVAVAVDTPPRKRPSLLFAAAHRRVRLLKGCTWRAQTEIFAPKLPVGEIKANAARRVRLLVRDSRNGGQSEQVSFTDRLVAALAYLLPLMAGLRYGRFFFREFPISAQILVPLQPVIQLYYYTPLSGFIIFLGLYMGIALNRNFSRFVRFNAMQAILLDISLSLPTIIEWIIRPPSSGMALQMYIASYNAIWVFVFACVVYGVVACLAGAKPRLPIVADAADHQVL